MTLNQHVKLVFDKRYVKLLAILSTTGHIISLDNMARLGKMVIEIIRKHNFSVMNIIVNAYNIRKTMFYNFS